MIATDLHAQRATQYPAHVAKGTLTAADAATGIRIAAAIEADWHHVRTLQPRAVAPAATKAEKVTTLEDAVTRTRLRAGKAGQKMPKLAQRYVGDLGELHHLAETGWFSAHKKQVAAFVYAAEYAELVETLLWWERRPLGHLFIASINIAAGVRRPNPNIAEAA
ncbi:hypothetical protein [Sphingomonas sp. KC8]|uniref:hypothetical protein n=1 Tax=Sphingomonas sp. KC8 TaxID=1030157 RepID=UPI000319EFCB|nr:hypothetical protein [Sphingomonas sp. KC8]ARS29050.1 hypothetical protein KC8_17410 [Sphingomonas sp. KC8]